MLDKRKVRLMTRTAIYEKQYGDEDFKIGSYYQKDYSSLNTWITIIWITIGYGLICALFFLAWGTSLVEGITLPKLFIVFSIALGAYLALLIVYGIGVSSFYKKKHMQAKRRIKRYLRDISRLEKMTNKKETDRV